MSAADIIAKLDRVRQVGAGRWLACCPCHESRSKSSLAIREEADGRVLVHDFGGCATVDILRRLGLDFDALYPPGRAAGTTVSFGEVAPDVTFIPGDVLRACADDILVAAVCASDLATGATTPEAVRPRLWEIAQRLAAAVRATQPPRRGQDGRRR